MFFVLSVADGSNTYTNATWAELAGIPLKELNVGVPLLCWTTF